MEPNVFKGIEKEVDRITEQEATMYSFIMLVPLKFPPLSTPLNWDLMPSSRYKIKI